MQNSTRTKTYIVLYSKLYNKVVLNSAHRNNRWNIRSNTNEEV